MSQNNSIINALSFVCFVCHLYFKNGRCFWWILLQAVSILFFTVQSIPFIILTSCLALNNLWSDTGLLNTGWSFMDCVCSMRVNHHLAQYTRHVLKETTCSVTTTTLQVARTASVFVSSALNIVRIQKWMTLRCV